MLGKGLASKSALCEIGHGTSDPAGAKQLANRISDVSTEKPTPIGLAPKTAAAISGKVYRFPPNPTNIKSVSLILTDPQPRYDIEVYADGFAPSGLDGRSIQSARRCPRCGTLVWRGTGTGKTGCFVMRDLAYSNFRFVSSPLLLPSAYRGREAGLCAEITLN
jgi:hypothetical protein